jgi:hypothetical protein
MKGELCGLRVEKGVQIRYGAWYVYHYRTGDESEWDPDESLPWRAKRVVARGNVEARPSPSAGGRR